MKFTDDKASTHVTVKKNVLITICSFQAPVVLGEDPLLGNEIKCLLIIIQNQAFFTVCVSICPRQFN